MSNTTQELIEKLVGNEIPDAELKELGRLIDEMKKKGFDPDGVFPLGTVVPDIAGARFKVTPDMTGDLLKAIVDSGILLDFTTFPVGIVNTDQHQIFVRIGNRMNRGMI